MALEIMERLKTKAKEELESAALTANPLWVGITSGETELWSRRATYFDWDDAQALWVNRDALLWKHDGKKIVCDGCLLAKTPTGPSFMTGPMVIPRTINRYESILVPSGNLRVTVSITGLASFR